MKNLPNHLQELIQTVPADASYEDVGLHLDPVYKHIKYKRDACSFVHEDQCVSCTHWTPAGCGHPGVDIAIPQGTDITAVAHVLKWAEFKGWRVFAETPAGLRRIR